MAPAAVGDVTGVPPVSVVMPVHNALPFLDDAVASITSQSFGDFEFVILDDASEDGSRERLRDLAAGDTRIRLFESPVRLGPLVSSRQVVAYSRAALVARMDADDIAHPDRLRRQVGAFAAEPAAGLVGTLHALIDARGRLLRGLELAPLARSRPAPPIQHPSIMVRRSAFDRAGGYRDGTAYWEDVDLYLRMARVAGIFVIPEALLRSRHSATATRARSVPRHLEPVYDAMHRALRASAGEPAGREDRIYPTAFVTIGTPRLWAGLRPGILAGLLARGALGVDRITSYALAWGLAAAISPALLRTGLSAAARLRERFAPAWIAGQPWVRWQPMIGAVRADQA